MRYLFDIIKNDSILSQKMTFISGPRQIGKTTLGKAFLLHKENYFNWDEQKVRLQWIKDPKKLLSIRREGAVVLDEFHKDPKWKSRLKGLFDSFEHPVSIIVTGSAKLDLYRKGGDSLLGRYIPYRLHGFSVAEDPLSPILPDQILQTFKIIHKFNDLLNLGTFPEPLYAQHLLRAKRWSRLRMERILTEDVRDLKNIRNIQNLVLLNDLLPLHVGSLLSINNLAENIQVSFDTVKTWITTLENLYVCFLIKPFSKKQSRLNQSVPKLYLYDILPVSNQGAKLENLLALHLLKACHLWTDMAQGNFDLRFLRSKDNKEVDFLILRDNKPWIAIECKSKNKDISKSLLYFKNLIGFEHGVQLVLEEQYDRYYPEFNIRVMGYEKFLSGWV